jgi:hypothetical protein
MQLIGLCLSTPLFRFQIFHRTKELNRLVLLGLGLTLLGVAADKEVDEEVGKRSKVDAVGVGGEDLSRVGQAGSVLVKVDEEVDSSKRSSDEELGDLHGGEGLLEDSGDTDVEGGKSVVGVHQGVDEGVEDAEDPDGRSHVAVKFVSLNSRFKD